MELVICNAKIVDVDTGEEKLSDVFIRDGQITSVKPAGKDLTKKQDVINADGMYLLPGLIDFHTHLFRHGSGFGMDADLLPETGVTTAVDMGTAGWVNFPALYTCDLYGKKPGIYAYINISPIGQAGKGISEPLDDSVLDVDKIHERIEEYSGIILGLKVRISRSIVKELGLKPLERAVEIGDKLNLPVCVHTTDPPEGADKVAAILRPGDVYSHTYHHKGNTILGSDGRVLKGIKDARNRGVLMEVGNGRVNFSFATAIAASREGFWPDIISSDSTLATFHKEIAMWDLPTVMSKFMAMGMPFNEVVRAVSITPARRLGIDKIVGNISPGYEADLWLCKKEEGEFTFKDSEGGEIKGTCMLRPVTTILKGRILQQNNDK